MSHHFVFPVRCVYLRMINVIVNSKVHPIPVTPRNVCQMDTEVPM